MAPLQKKSSETPNAISKMNTEKIIMNRNRHVYFTQNHEGTYEGITKQERQAIICLYDEELQKRDTL